VARHRAETQYQAARDAEQRGQYAKARELYAALQRQSPNTPAYAHRMGVVCIQLEDFTTAGKYFEHARKLDPQNPALLADMGYSAYLQKDYESAEALLRESVHLSPGDARATNNLAMALGYQGRYDESLETFQKFNPQTQALLNLAFVQSQRSDFLTAKATYERVLTAEPGNKVATKALQILVAELDPPPKSTATVASTTAVPAESDTAVTDVPHVTIRPAWDLAPLPAPTTPTPEAVAASAIPQTIPVDDPLPVPALTAQPAADPVSSESTSRWAPTQVSAVRPESKDEVTFELPERITTEPSDSLAASLLSVPPTAGDAEPVEVATESRVAAPNPGGETPEAAAPQVAAADSREANPPDAPDTAAELVVEAEPVVELVPAPPADELEGVLIGDDFAPEPESSDAEELAGLDWAQEKLAQDRRDIASGARVSADEQDCLHGYCPVVLRDERRLEPASDEYETEFQGQHFRFSSAAARERFLQHPHWYAPIEQGRDLLQVRSGSETLGSLEHACWFRHRLHLFSTAENLAAFRAAPRAYTVP